ncbi:MAG: phosphoribosylglycinamide formyltransferase [Telmatospirillum sp.]|nr:phosphoribosylglycinamide formyltransferase [Telmatospirillum sp.]
MTRLRVAALISGRGSNMAALVAAAANPDYPAEIALVLANVPGAGGLAVAAENGVATETLDHRSFADRAAFDVALDARLRDHQIEFVCLAGFMRLLTAGFVEKWRNRLLNIHPSLLPAYPGLDTHKRALADGVRVAGCTVHFVRAKMDVGPIVAQAAVPVLQGDDEDALAARVLKAEHVLYPQALRLVASGAATVDGEQVKFAKAPATPAILFNPPL